MFMLSKLLSNLESISPGAVFSVHEIHHTKKLDSPSGTALHLKKLLPDSTAVTAERIGDVPGIHTVTVELPGEIVSLRHEAKNRTVFASGAIYAAENLILGLPAGIHQFEILFINKIKKEMSYA